MISYI